MKLTAIILFGACLTASAHGYSQKITLNEDNAPIEKIFREIWKQSGFQFVYTDKTLSGAKPVTIHVKDEPLENVLSLCFDRQPFEFAMSDGAIVVKQKDPAPSPSVSSETAGSEIDIHGKLFNESGDPVVGATVQVKGSGQATATDTDGKFALRGVDENATLIFTGAEIETQEIKLRGRKEVLVSAKIKIVSVQDIVINQGYYTRKQRFNTGNVTRVDGKDIQKQPVTDPLMALEGRVAGLQISQNSGVPGANMIVQLRGQNFLSAAYSAPFNLNAPLYIVDGVPFGSTPLTSPDIGGGIFASPDLTGNGPGSGMSPFNSINTSDIESIEILKDGDATAIYGSRGANGVIIITTKKGKAGKMSCEVNLSTGTGKVARTMPLLNTSQYLQMRREAYKNDRIAFDPQNPQWDPDFFLWDTTRYTDWQEKLINHPAPFTNAQISLSGGNENVRYLIGGGYSSQGTLFPGHFKDQKASVHVNLSGNSANKHFQSTLNIDYTDDNSNLPGADLTSYVTLPPDAPSLYDGNGNLNWAIYQGRATWRNPLAYTLIHANAITDNLISNLNLSYLIAPGLKIQSSFGYHHTQMNQTILTPSGYFAPPVNNPANSRTNATAVSDSKGWIIEPQVNYIKKWGKGLLEVLAGGTFQEDRSSSSGEKVRGFSSDALIPNLSAGSRISFLSGTGSLYRYNSLYGRIGFNWDEKYLINLTARRDGSSRFGPGNQFGNFGAIGAGWIFSQENFVAGKLKCLSFGKLRVSYGSVGNDAIGDYKFLSTYSITGGDAPNYQGLAALSPTLIANPYLQWQTVKKLEGGIELGFFRDRLHLSVSYYRNRTGNQLVGYPLPDIAGFNSVAYNLPAVVQNSGTEITVNTINLRTKDFTWRTNLNVSIPENKLVSFAGLASSSYASNWQIGSSIFSEYRYHYTGVDPQTGMYTFANKSGSGGYLSPFDRVWTRPVTQQYFGGIQNTFSYKRIQLDIFFQFVKQRGFSYENYAPNEPGYDLINQPLAVLNRWQNPGDITNTQKYGYDGGTGTGALDVAYGTLKRSDGVITDASFVRLKNLALSYQFPEIWIRKAGLQTARAYMQAQNLWTITNYYGFDPETGAFNLPPVRMITFGVQLVF